MNKHNIYDVTTRIRDRALPGGSSFASSSLHTDHMMPLAIVSVAMAIDNVAYAINEITRPFTSLADAVKEFASAFRNKSF